jgi:glycosyltransferase involved in cell wall biosynthesis
LISDLFLACLGLQNINAPIRIRFEHTRFPHWGGRSGYTHFVQHLDPQRFQTLLHGSSDNDADLTLWLAPMRPLLKGLIRRGRMPWYKLSDFNAEILALASCLAGRTDIVHFLDGEHSAQFLPRMVRLANLSKVRTVATFHQPPQVAHAVVNGDLLRWFDQIVLVSPSQLPFFLQYVPEEKLRVILHGVDVEFFCPPESREERSSFQCITVGHWLREWKVLRQIAGILPDMTFDVVTDRETDLGGLANIRIHRSIDDSALADLYRSADALLLPLIDSTANNALLEGIASGLPVVATDLPAVRAYLPNGGGVFVPNSSVDGFVAALSSLQQDLPLRRAMGRTARARAEELAWPKLASEYEAIYMRLYQACRR